MYLLFVYKQKNSVLPEGEMAVLVISWNQHSMSKKREKTFTECCEPSTVSFDQFYCDLYTIWYTPHYKP